MIEWYKNWYHEPFIINGIIFERNPIYQGCISSITCPKCKINLVCDSSGKAGTKDLEKNIRYIQGPCCCGLMVCSDCKHDWRPKFD